MLTKVNSIGSIVQSYQNGNYHVTILNNGTKIRHTEENVFLPSHPESLDLKITDQCDRGCPYCHEESTVNGKHCDINKTINVLEHLPAGVELAIGGGNPLTHPELIPFLQWCKSRDFICSMTINSDHFHDMDSRILMDKLIYGLGLSYSREKMININYENLVCHVILGVHSLLDMMNAMRNYKKILILGFKSFGEGKHFNYSDSNMEELKDNLWKLFQMDGVISFDNLAIEQLKLEDYFYEYAWKEFYMGNDGDFTMYYDAVEQKFGRSSCTEKNQRVSSNYGILNFFNDLKGDK